MPDTASPSHFDPLVHLNQSDHPDAVAEARARAGRAVRDIGHALVGHHAPIELLDRVAAGLDALTAELEPGEQRVRTIGGDSPEWGSDPADGEEMSTYDERPVSGRSSPWGLDLVVRRDGDEVTAAVTLRAAHEGAPGRSHGGIVAALFDDIYGFVLAIRKQPAFTGELAVRYEAGVPIDVPMVARVRLERQEGRKLFMAGELTVDGAVVARSRATFITVEAYRLA